MAVLLRHKVPTYVVGSGRGRRTQGVNWTPFRAGGGFAQSSFFLPFPDLGNGAVDTMEGRGQVTPSFVRATAAATKLSTGLWKLDVASGTARYSYNGATTAVNTTGGYFAEGARTQIALNPRDMAQAAWVAVNVTPAQTSVGITGVTNSATRLTSAAIGASILQTVVAAASSRTYSVWLRRVTGTGTITISQGATTLDVTASLNSSTFTRVELNASVLNSAFGITFGASGDVIEADCNQFEAGGFASSPIPAAGTRNADVLTYPTSPWLNAAAGTMFVQHLPGGSAVAAVPYILNDGTVNENIFSGTGAAGIARFVLIDDGGVTTISITDAIDHRGLVTKQAGAWALNNFAAATNGVLNGTASAGTIPTVNLFTVGQYVAGAGDFSEYGTIARIAYWSRRLSNQQLQVLTS